MGQRYQSLSFGRAFGSTALALIGTTVNALRSTPTLLGGVALNPFRLPQDFDPRRPVSLFCMINTAANSAVNGQQLQFQLTTTIITPGVITELGTLTFNWPVPNGWLTTQPQIFFIDNGNGVTYDPNTFPATGRVGVRLVRNGPAVLDTYAQSTDLATYLTFLYSTKFPWLPVQI